MHKPSFVNVRMLTFNRSTLCFDSRTSSRSRPPTGGINHPQLHGDKNEEEENREDHQNDESPFNFYLRLDHGVSQNRYNDESNAGVKRAKPWSVKSPVNNRPVNEEKSGCKRTHDMTELQHTPPALLICSSQPCFPMQENERTHGGPKVNRHCRITRKSDVMVLRAVAFHVVAVDKRLLSITSASKLVVLWVDKESI